MDGPSTRAGGRAWRLAFAAALLAAALLVGLRGGLPGDGVAREEVRAGYSPEADDGLIDLLGALGDPLVALVTVALLALQVRRSHGTAAALTVVAAAAVVVPNAALKLLVGESPLLPGEGAPQLHFPSGHVAYATALFGLLALLARRAGRRDLAVACAAVVVLMGPARVLAGTHVPSDVLGGHLVGAAWLLALSALPGQLRPRW